MFVTCSASKRTVLHPCVGTRETNYHPYFNCYSHWWTLLYLHIKFVACCTPYPLISIQTGPQALPDVEFYHTVPQVLTIHVDFWLMLYYTFWSPYWCWKLWILIPFRKERTSCHHTFLPLLFLYLVMRKKSVSCHPPKKGLNESLDLLQPPLVICAHSLLSFMVD